MPTLTKKEIDLTLDIYEDNGHNRQKLKTIAESYTPPSTTIDRPPSPKDRIIVPQTAPPTPNPPGPTTLGTIQDTAEDTTSSQQLTPTDQAELQRRPYACIPYIPGISSQLKRALTKAGCKTFFRSGTKLKDILCSKNKTHPPRTHKKGIYRIDCPCSENAIYIGQTGRSIKTRAAEHKKASERHQWHHSGITQHKESCPSPVDWDNPTIITTMSNKNKNKLTYDLKIREALEIRRHNCGPGRGLNEDWGAYVRTNIWAPVFDKP
jgi:hypothetical protein